VRGHGAQIAAALACALLAVAAGCSSDDGEEVVRPPGPVASEGVLVCDGGSTSIETPVVRAHADGLHLAVRNPSHVELDFEYELVERGGGDRGGGTSNAPVGTTHLVLPFAGAAFDFTCEGGGTERIEVVDEAGVAKSSQLDCEEPTGVEVKGVAPVHGDPLSIARRELGSRKLLRPGDVLERSVPTGREKVNVRLVRDDRVVGVVQLSPAAPEGGWLIVEIPICREIVPED
jgi:hypothetical protein